MGKEGKEAAKTRKIRVLNSAYKDIEEITDFIAFDNQQPLNAVKVARIILETINKIEQNPFTFKECEGMPTKTKMYRKAVCLSWLIIYKITATEIIILGVIHGARNPSKIKGFRKVK